MASRKLIHQRKNQPSSGFSSSPQSNFLFLPGDPKINAQLKGLTNKIKDILPQWVFPSRQFHFFFRQFILQMVSYDNWQWTILERQRNPKKRQNKAKTFKEKRRFILKNWPAKHYILMRFCVFDVKTKCGKTSSKKWILRTNICRLNQKNLPG